MRKYFFYLLVFTCLFLVSCGESKNRAARFYVHNVTVKPIYITSNDKHLSDTIPVEPGGYARVGYCFSNLNVFSGAYYLGIFEDNDMYIGYDDIFYRVDSTDVGSCYWPRAYRPATEAEEAIVGEVDRYWARYVYDLTEEFILDQIKE